MIGAHRVSDQTLYEYVDGGLPATTRLRIAVLARIDRRLAERVAKVETQNRYLQELSRSVLLEPVPERMSALLARAALNSEDWYSPGISWQNELTWVLLALLVVAGGVGLFAF